MRKWCRFVCTTVADPILESYQIIFSHRLWRLWPPTSDLVIPTLAPRNLLGPRASTPPPNKKHLDRFIRFCRAHVKVGPSVGHTSESCGTAEPIRCRLGAVDSRIYLFAGRGCIDVPSWCTSSWLSFLAADRTRRRSPSAVYVFSRVDSWNSLWTERQHPLVTDYSIYWWPSGKRK